MLDINDPNGKLYAEGAIFLHEGKNSMFNFTSRLEHFHPDSLHLTNKYEAPDISCTLNADFTGNNIDNLEGSITIDSLSFKTKPDSFFFFPEKVQGRGYGAFTGPSSDHHLRRLERRSDECLFLHDNHSQPYANIKGVYRL